MDGGRRSGPSGTSPGARSGILRGMDVDRRAFLGQACCLVAGLGSSGAARRRLDPPFPELRTAGSPGALGLAHGRTFASRVEHNVGFYLDYLARRTRRDEQRLLATAGSFAPVIAEHFPALFEEMDGIAKGAKRKLEEVLLVNARTDLLVIGRHKSGSPDKNLPGCTALALVDNVGRRSRIALGQNWDWSRALRKNTVLLRLRPDDGPKIVTFTEAGMVGKIGFNDRRLGVCLNFLSHRTDDPGGEPGVPVHVLLRAVMGCDTLAAAVDLISSVPRCASANFLMAQAAESGHRAVDLEWTPSMVGRLPIEDGVLVHTNHFKHETLGHGSTRGESYQRDVRAAKLATDLRDAEPEPCERIKRALTASDRDPVPLSKGSTQAGVVMDLSRNRIHLAFGPPHQRGWVERPGA